MKKAPRPQPVEAAAGPVAFRGWKLFLSLAAVVFLALIVYAPALRGPFLFDDLGLPFTRTADLKLDWTFFARSVRPLLYVMFWWEGHEWGMNPAPYHFVNLFLHLLNSALAFFIVRRVLGLAGHERRAELVAALCAGLFLFHPLQTEGVSYIASRSETMSVLFTYSSIALYLRRSTAGIGWGVALGALALNAMGVLTKEHAVVAPAVLLLTDFWWNPGFTLAGVKKNWRYYILCVAGGAGALAFIWRLLLQNTTAGFGMKDFTWYQYFFTQCRAIWVYLRLFVLPVGQNLDYQFPVSHDVFEHGAIAGLAGLLAVTAAAWIYRRKFPLASYGWFVFLVMIAPTSSIVPIQDTLAERRVYLPFLGLLFIVAEAVLRLATNYARQAACATVIVLCALLTWQRNDVYTSSIAMWQDALRGNPENARAWFQLGYALYREGRAHEAVEAYAKVPELKAPDYELYIDWALALDQDHRSAEAVEMATKALGLRSTAHAWSVLGMVRGKQGQNELALQALDRAIGQNPRYTMAWVYRGNVYLQLGNQPEALKAFEQAASIEPDNEAVQQGLAAARRMLSGGGR